VLLVGGLGIGGIGVMVIIDAIIVRVI